MGEMLKETKTKMLEQKSKRHWGNSEGQRQEKSRRKDRSGQREDGEGKEKKFLI